MGNNVLAASILRDSNATQGGANALAEQYPRLYGAFQGLLGNAPDEVGGSVLDGSRSAQKSGAELTYLPGLLGEVVAANKLTGLLGLATKGTGYGKVPEMLEKMKQGYEATGQVPKLGKVPLAVLSPEEMAAFNAGRPAAAPQLTSPVLDWRGTHQFQSRAANSPQGNQYPISELADQLNALTSQNLAPAVDSFGRTTLQATAPRTNYAGKQIKDQAVINVDANGRGELFSVIPSGDGLRKGQKAPAKP